MPRTDNFLTDCFDRDNPPTLDRSRRSGTLSLPDLQRLVAAHPLRFQGPRGEAARGLLLLWHDHWEAAHHIAQSDEGEPHHDLMHAIAHRREGDYSNSGYWFRGAGRHDAFTLVSERVRNLLLAEKTSGTGGVGDTLLAAVITKGAWNAKGFLEAVRSNAGGEPLLRAVQAEEIIAVFESWTA